MNWMRTLLAGLAAGIVVFLADFVLHGQIMAGTYSRYGAFSQEQVNPLYFLLVSVCIAIPAALFFTRTRNEWAAGFKGGATFGLWLGFLAFFGNFYMPLVIKGFPYYLAWCWGGINVIEGLIGGAILGLLIKRN